MQASHIDGGFASPVLDSQDTFHALMRAMSEPGTIQSLKESAQPPALLNTSAAAVALTLCDQDTVAWIDPILADAEGVRVWLSFHSGATITPEPQDAHFLIVADPANLPSFATLAQGTQEYPDRSASVILQVEALVGGQNLDLTGPGILNTSRFAPIGLPKDFVAQWRDNNAQFPRGVDVILAVSNEIACLPRTTRLQIVEG